MIHQYQNNGYNIVLDVNSGCVHVVDEPGYEVIACLNRMNENQTVQTLKEESTWNQLKDELEGKYSEEELRDILDDVTDVYKRQDLCDVRKWKNHREETAYISD